jgi:hypothetical protein
MISDHFFVMKTSAILSTNTISSINNFSFAAEKL